MPTKPTEIIDWATTQSNDPVSGKTNRNDPGAPKKITGFTREERPLRQTLNWLLWAISLWKTYFEEKTDENAVNIGLNVASIGVNASDILTVNSLTVVNKLDIANNSILIGNNQALSNNNFTQIGINTGDIGSNATQIGINTGAINTNITNITNAENRLTDIEADYTKYTLQGADVSVQAGTWSGTGGYVAYKFIGNKQIQVMVFLTGGITGSTSEYVSIDFTNISVLFTGGQFLGMMTPACFELPAPIELGVVFEEGTDAGKWRFKHVNSDLAISNHIIKAQFFWSTGI